MEYPSVFFYLDYVSSIYEKNSSYFLKNFDRNYVAGIYVAYVAFYEKTLDHKKKKKIDSTARKMFSAMVFNKGMLHYYRALSKLLFIFIKYGALPGSFGDKEPQRFKGRFLMFGRIMFTNPVDY